ncbi:MAG: prolipoprotein diacylglyceryl transferase, partial [Lachnospiraceae bacterium]|nr:prolipoprotein diacylglyceryl transferase [Lachnospiraceae bacterium]
YHKRKKYHGQMCLFYLGGYGIGRFIIEGIRTDRLLIPGTQIAVSQLLGLVLFIFSIIMNTVMRIRLSRMAS